MATSLDGPQGLQIERHPFDYDLPARFPNRRLIAEFFTGVAYVADQDDRFYLLLDESVMLERVIPDTEPIIDSLIGIYEFSDSAERDAFARAHGWLAGDAG